MALAGLAAYSDTSSDDGESKHNSQADECIIESKRKFDDPFTDEDSDSGRPSDFLNITQQSDSEESSEENEDASISNAEKAADLPNPLRLPAPAIGNASKSDYSVFGNKYAAQEKAKLAILEKHVTMTEEKPTNNKVCFKFRKGQCRRGKNCRYSHDLGFQPASYAQESEREILESATTTSDNFPKETKRKKPGVTNTLFPSKKAKQALDEQRAQERPWTVTK